MQSSGRLPIHPPTVRQPDWLSYVQVIPSCAEVFPSLDCLRSNTTSDELYDAFDRAGITSSSFHWVPVLDGPGGMVPDYPSQLDAPNEINIAIMYGTVMDEGKCPMRTAGASRRIPKMLFLGTLAIPQDTDSPDDILSGMISLISPSSRGDDLLQQSLSELLRLYPDDPSAGSPFNRGNETFGLNKEFKRYAAICEFLFHTCCISFHVPRQLQTWLQVLSVGLLRGNLQSQNLH